MYTNSGHKYPQSLVGYWHFGSYFEKKTILETIQCIYVCSQSWFQALPLVGVTMATVRPAVPAFSPRDTTRHFLLFLTPGPHRVGDSFTRSFCPQNTTCVPGASSPLTPAIPFSENLRCHQPRRGLVPPPPSAPLGGASGFSATQAFASTNITDSWDSLMALGIPLLPAPHFYIPLAALAGFWRQQAHLFCIFSARYGGKPVPEEWVSESAGDLVKMQRPRPSTWTSAFFFTIYQLFQQRFWYMGTCEGASNGSGVLWLSCLRKFRINDDLSPML